MTRTTTAAVMAPWQRAGVVRRVAAGLGSLALLSVVLTGCADPGPATARPRGELGALAVQEGQLLWVGPESDASPDRVLEAATVLTRLHDPLSSVGITTAVDAAVAGPIDSASVPLLVRAAEYAAAVDPGRIGLAQRRLDSFPAAQVPVENRLTVRALSAEAQPVADSGSCPSLGKALLHDVTEASTTAVGLSPGSCRGVITQAQWTAVLAPLTTVPLGRAQAAQLRYVSHLAGVFGVSSASLAAAAATTLTGIDRSGDDLPVHVPLQYLNDLTRLAGSNPPAVGNIVAGLRQTVTIDGADQDVMRTDVVGRFFLYSWLQRTQPSDWWRTWAGKDPQAWFFLQQAAPENADAAEKALATAMLTDDAGRCAGVDLNALGSDVKRQAGQGVPGPFRLTVLVKQAAVLALCGRPDALGPVYPGWISDLERTAAEASPATATIIRWSMAESSCIRTGAAGRVSASPAIGGPDAVNIQVLYAVQRLKQLATGCDGGWWSLDGDIRRPRPSSAA